MCVRTEKITRQWKSTLNARVIDALPEQEYTEMVLKISFYQVSWTILKLHA